jgi:exopolysaccharide biosynthesis polyprenyl glycosylphosphotransferase
LAFGVDALGLCAGFLLAGLFIPVTEQWLSDRPWSPSYTSAWALAAGTGIAALLLLNLLGMSEIRAGFGERRVARGVIMSLVPVGIGYILVGAVFGGAISLNRKLIILSLIFGAMILILLRLRLPKLYSVAERARRILLVGAHTPSIRALLRFSKDKTAEFTIVGVIDSYRDAEFFRHFGVERLGDRDSLPRVVEENGVDTLIVLNDADEYAKAVLDTVERSLKLDEVHVRTKVPLFMAQDVKLQFLEDLPLMKVYSRENEQAGALWRVVLDRGLAAVGLILAIPIFLIVVPLVRLTSNGPALYSQRRLGLHNEPFTIFKFRTMVADAEKRSGAVLAQKNDPRVTPVGKFLRATRLDEVPQLFNVLTGTMSLVGPRPERPEFQHLYLETIPWYSLRARCKPGITGLAQVAGEYDTSPQRKLLYDVTYFANMTLLLDLRILAATVITVVSRRGH